MHDFRAIAHDWIDSWNAHDLERILGHYSPDIVFLSPLAEQRVGSGRVVGADALRAYWAGGLAAQPDLHFTLSSVLIGHSCLTILYTNHRGQNVAETLELDEDGKVIRACACYASA